ncbi:MAG: 16S rRNA (cytosine(967)-C(5))-methyltransferase RsmB [Syntrophomonadaceae bacterium]|jgi:16S rRNA (cytosine967-C5)-methyltransferase
MSKINHDHPRLIALEVIAAVTHQGAFTNLALEKGLRKSSLVTADRHLVTEIVNGTIRMLKHLDWVLNLFLGKKIDKQNPWLRDNLRMALYQILFMERIPDYAAVDDAVKLTRLKAGNQLAGVCNGVLRNIVRNRAQIQYPSRNQPVEYLSVYYSHPEWMVQDWLSQFGFEATEKMLEYNNQPTGLTLRWNCLKGDRDNLVSLLRAEKVECAVDINIPWAIKVSSLTTGINELETFRSGWFYIQDGASMLAAPVLDPQPGELVYDLCSGVGGKSTHMAEYMNNQGGIKAFDIYEQKLRLLNYNCERLGITIVDARQRDILSLENDFPRAERVLLDAPCSGLGVLSRRADIRWQKDKKAITELISLQKHLLNKAGQMVEAGGRLVYTTCTINDAENQQVVLDFLNNHPDFYLENLNERLSFLPLDQDDSKEASTGMITLLPGKYRTDGVFYASMRRN